MNDICKHCSDIDYIICEDCYNIRQSDCLQFDLTDNSYISACYNYLFLYDGRMGNVSNLFHYYEKKYEEREEM